MSFIDPLHRALAALYEWVAHILVLAGLLIGFRCIEYLINFLWSDGDRLLFGILPLNWVFDGADLGALIGFLSYGVFGILRAFSGQEKQNEKAVDLELGSE